MLRVVFTEITPRAIKEAMGHPREIAGDLVDAQQARRALDYLVGFNLSPVLWRKVQRGLGTVTIVILVLAALAMVALFGVMIAMIGVIASMS